MANLDVTQLSAFIFDLDGIIWRGDSAIDGAVDSIKRLQDAGKHCVYCTNNSSSTPAHYVEKLAGMGITAQEDDVMTSAWATALYLSSQLTGQFSAYVVGEEGLVAMLRKTGARVVTMQGMNPATKDIIEDTAFPVDCVVAGIDRSFNFDKLRLAQGFILNGAQFIATNRDATFPVADGIAPGAGAIVSAIETASGVAPLTIGKPQSLMPLLLMQRFNFKPEQTAFVGDRLNTDMVAAHRANMPGILVTTGISTREDADRAKGLQKPDAIFDNLTLLTNEVLKNLTVQPSQSAPLNPLAYDDVAGLPSIDEAAVSTSTTTIADEPVAATPVAATPVAVAPVAATIADVTPADATPVAATFETITPGNVTPATPVAPVDFGDLDNLDSGMDHGPIGGGAKGANAMDDFGFESLELLPTTSTEQPPVTTTTHETTPVAEPVAASAAPPAPTLKTFDEDEPQNAIPVEPAASPFAFTLDEAEGAAAIPRPAGAKSGAAATDSSAKATKDDAQADQGANIQPGVNNKDINVGEPLDNWWESIEDAFKKG